MEKKDFLERFAITEAEFNEAGLSWEDLCYIARDYAYKLPELRRIREEFLQEFIKNKDHRTGLHSYRTRIKSPWHLVEKIIRKRCENFFKYRFLTKDNYMKFVTDTIGFRGLILYREDWVIFHKYLIRHFENNPHLYIRNCLTDFHPDKDMYMAEPPKVHMRLGDFSDIYSDWISSENILDRKHYRSVHYILKYQGVYMEVQIRTLFEEGWGEIDHHILYPYKKSDPMLSEFSELLNRLSGMGDEMGSFFKRLCDVSSENFKPKQTTVNPRVDLEAPKEYLEKQKTTFSENAQEVIRSLTIKPHSHHSTPKAMERDSYDDFVKSKLFFEIINLKGNTNHE